MLCGDPDHGEITIPVYANGQVCFTYTPDPEYNGPDELCVQVCDAGGLCSSATVNIIVTPVNDPPSITGKTVETPYGTPIEVCLDITDIDPNSTFTASVCGDPANGTLGTPGINGSQVCVTYTPVNGFTGVDEFCIEVCDNGNPELCSTATITVNVLCPDINTWMAELKECAVTTDLNPKAYFALKEADGRVSTSLYDSCSSGRCYGDLLRFL